MDSVNLSLRQRKLLHYIQNQQDYITGQELAGHLQVSARTIRNDVNEINRNLTGKGVQILSKRSLGYLLSVENRDYLKELNKASDSFLTREDRIRHMAFRLCLSDEPVNLYDLEDEMFISRTTLEHDLKALRLRYVLPNPHIEFHRSRNTISFERDERKRRSILNLLFTSNWNYNARGNAYYQYQYLEEDVINLVMDEVNYYLRQYNILLEDINMVILNLSIAIMYYRITSGHMLESGRQAAFSDAASVHAVDDLLDTLEEKLACTFPPAEREEIYLHVSCGRMLDASKLNFATVDTYFQKDTLDFTDEYLREIRETFCFDFSENEDFYITLLQYLRYLKLPVHYLNDVQTHMDMARSNLLIEYEIAFLIQPLALKYTGSYLDQTELMYLAFCISGALEYDSRTAPKLKTVIMGHLNLTSCWYLKQKLLSAFGDHIDLTALLPVYIKDNYDFSKIDLIVTTANKTITTEPNCKTILISPFFTPADQASLESYIFRRRINRLYRTDLPSVRDLFDQAFWHECIQADNRFSIIEQLAGDFSKQGYVSPEYLQSVLMREAIMPFAFQPSFVFMYSLSPSTRTCLSIATLEHRVKWNSHKIRTVIMAAIRPEDATLVFRIINELFYSGINLNDAQFLKTKDEIMNFLAEI